MRASLVAALAAGGAVACCGAWAAGCAPHSPDDCASHGLCPADDASLPDAPEGLDAGGDATDGRLPDGAMTREDGEAGGGDGGSDAADAADGFDGFDGGSVCDPTRSPHDQPCVLSDGQGVFVSPSGSDVGAGTQVDPVKTIGEGIAKAVALGKARVYVCDGTYGESIVLTQAVSLYGALGCPGGSAAWSYLDGGAAQVTAAPNQIAFAVSGVSTPVAIEDLAFSAADASGQDDAGNGHSSIALLVSGSTVTFRRCVFSAGNGADGSEGGTGSNYTGATAPNGQPADEAGTGGAGGSVQCTDGTSSQGGVGGNGARPSGTNGGDGGASPLPPPAPGQDGQGGAGGMFSCGSGAHPGANGTPGAAGAPANSPQYGSLQSTGWVATSAGAGGNANPGQGGGGGGGTANPLQGGTGGGAGGCGGAGGGWGGAGGASIGVASVGANVTLEGCTIRSGNGGGGGQGGSGQAGQNGGAFPASTGCTGSYGGNGAGGGGGAGGTGGLSTCIAFKGAAPSGIPSCTTGSPGPAGIGGAGGAGGITIVGGPAGADGGTGLAGLAASVWQSP